MVKNLFSVALTFHLAVIVGGRTAGDGITIDILGGDGLSLWPDVPDSIPQSCGVEDVFMAEYPGFALPKNAMEIHIVVQAKLFCQNITHVESNPSHSLFFQLGSYLHVSIDCHKGYFLVSFGENTQSFDSDMEILESSFMFSLSINPSKEDEIISVCINSSIVKPIQSLSYTAVSALMSRFGSLLNEGITIGKPEGGSLRADIHSFVVSTVHSSGSCPRFPNEGYMSEAVTRISNIRTEVKPFPSDRVFVGETVTLTASAFHQQGILTHARVTAFGLPRSGCEGTDCGDMVFDSSSDSGTLAFTAKVRYPLPGRWLIRLEATDGTGTINSTDCYISVFKLRDWRREAPCCRTTPFIIAEQLGRPLHRSIFREESTMNAGREQLGWTKQYLERDDLESERLFDYSILAPPTNVEGNLLKVWSCHDAHVAGVNTSRIMSPTITSKEVSGHNKPVVFVPLSFPWANKTEVLCEEHWTDLSMESSAQCLNASCSMGERHTYCTGCDRASIRRLIEETNMYDQFNQAIIQSSFGALSLHPLPHVLPTVEVPRDDLLPVRRIEHYYDSPARLAVTSQPFEAPWLHIVLSPVVKQREPAHRAWSFGLKSKSFTITRCYATMYWGLHELGHRLSFEHPQLLLSLTGYMPPINPLDSNEIILADDDSYSARLDVMSCCKSDYNLYHRTIAGWLRGSKRLVLGPSELSKSGVRRLVLWPFDRSESRGQLLSISIRRGPNEVIMLGFRSASHWEDNSGSSQRDTLEENRENVQGITAEYLRRLPDGQWTQSSAIVDFNQLHGDWPNALPPLPGFPPHSFAFVALQEGKGWYDRDSRLLLLIERYVPCSFEKDYNGFDPNSNFYKVSNFYGYRGEWPGREEYLQSNYSGYSILPCAQLRLRTNADPPRGQLNATISIQNPALELQNNSIQVEVLNPSESSIAKEDMLPGCQEAVGQSAKGLHDLVLSVSWSQEDDVISIVWKDRFNRTIASGMEAEIKTSTSALPIRIRVLADDGRQTLLAITAVSETEFKISYKYYLLDRFEYLEETIVAPSRNDKAHSSGNKRCGYHQNASDPSNRITEKHKLAIILASVAVVPMSALIGLLVLVQRRKTMKQRSNDYKTTNNSVGRIN